jgi:hypothetical protein
MPIAGGSVCMEAISESGLFGRRMPPSRGGDWHCGESRGIEYAVTAGELNDDGGAEPDEEYTEAG